jgi:hypothetical protein
MRVRKPAFGGRSWRPGGRAVLGHPLSSERIGGGDGFLPWRFARPHRRHRFVPLSNAGDELDRLVKWHKSLGQQLEINENPVGAPSALDPLESPSLARELGPIRLSKE